MPSESATTFQFGRTYSRDYRVDSVEGPLGESCILRLLDASSGLLNVLKTRRPHPARAVLFFGTEFDPKWLDLEVGSTFPEDESGRPILRMMGRVTTSPPQRPVWPVGTAASMSDGVAARFGATEEKTAVVALGALRHGGKRVAAQADAGSEQAWLDLLTSTGYRSFVCGLPVFDQRMAEAIEGLGVEAVLARSMTRRLPLPWKFVANIMGER